MLLEASGDILALDTLADRTVIRRITAEGNVTTVGENLQRAENGHNVRPLTFGRDSQGAFVFNYTDGTIRRSDSPGALAVLGGAAGSTQVTDGVGTSARFFHPGEIVVDREDRIFVIDGDGSLVREGVPVQGAPTIVTQPASLTVNPGSAAQFAVAATGYPLPTVQWNFNGAAVAGATASTYTIGSATASQAGDYTVTVTNNQGSVTSAVARLTVNAGPAGGGGGGGGGTGTGGGTSGGSAGRGGGGGANEPWFTLAFGVLWGVRRFLRRAQE
jgi:hypothetical protein